MHEVVIKPSFPPSSSIVSLWFWEGFLATTEKSPDELLKEESASKLDTIFVGNDNKSLERVCNAKKLKFTEFSKCLLDAVGNLKTEIYMKLDPKRKVQLFGTKDFLSLSLSEIKKRGISLQIAKVDRYQNIPSFELGTFLTQTTVYLDAPAALLLMLGILSSFSIKISSDHYFVLFSPTQLSMAEKNTDLYFSIKRSVQDELRSSIKEIGGWMDEYIYLKTIFNKELIKRAKEKLGSLEQNSIGLRIIKIAKEGQTHKVYMDFPIEINLMSKIYKDIEFIEEIYKSSSSLSCYVYMFLAKNKMKETNREGYHAYRAIMKLFMYVQTLDPIFLEEYNREVATLRDIILSKKDEIEACRDKFPRLIDREITLWIRENILRH
ncbi:MAG: hypothetical protein ACP5J1_07200 [Fervidicoccaceae archaeon]